MKWVVAVLFVVVEWSLLAYAFILGMRIIGESIHPMRNMFAFLFGLVIGAVAFSALYIALDLTMPDPEPGFASYAPGNHDSEADFEPALVCAYNPPPSPSVTCCCATPRGGLCCAEAGYCSGTFVPGCVCGR